MIPPFPNFIAYLRAQDRAEATVRGYLADLTACAHWFSKTYDEAFTPGAITPSVLRAFRQHLLLEKRAKASTVNRHLAALRVYAAWAVQAGVLDANPAAQVRGVAQVPSGPKYLDKKGQDALQRVMEHDLQVARLRYPKRWKTRQRDYSLTIFLLHTGLRLHETLAVRLEDLVLTARKGQVTVQAGKGNRQRTVPLNADARQAVRAWLAVRPATPDNPHLWLAQEGEAQGELTSRAVQRVLHRYGQAAGLPHLTPHVLRHTFAKNLVEQGVGLEKVAALLGYASLNTTRIYITPNQHDLEKAVETLATSP